MGVDSEGRVAGPVRRSVLTALPAGLALTALAACTSGGDRTGDPTGRPTSGRTTSAPSADDLARARAVATARDLLARVTAATSLPREVRDAVAAGHRAQLVALGAADAPLVSAPASPSATATPDRPSAAAVVSGETAGAREALADLAGVGREVATVLVRVAAARAAHADVVARAADRPVPGTLAVPAAARGTGAADPATDPAAGTPTATGASPSPTLAAPDVEALSRLVEAEHAAVFGYALVVPRVADARQDLARRLWEAHRSARDLVESTVVAAGAEPPAALPAYAVDVPASSGEAADLAARIEGGLAAVAVWSAGRGTGPVRARAADLAVAATRDQARWLGAVPAFTV